MGKTLLIVLFLIFANFLTARPVLHQPFLEYPIYETKLANGLRVVIYVDSSTPTVSTQIWYNVGSIYDPPGRSGLSHLLEHMDCTKHYKPREISALVDAYGGEDNAFTSYLYVCYWIDLAKEYYELALKLGAERMVNLSIPKEKFQSERLVVMEERRLRENEPHDALWEQFNLLVYKLHPYRHPIIGWMSEIENITLKDLIDHYHRYWTPSNAVCVIAGAVEPNDALNKVIKYFGKIKSKSISHPQFIVPKQQGEQQMTIYKKVSLPSMVIGYRTLDQLNADYYPLEVLEALLAYGKDSRLYKKLILEKQFALRVYAWNDIERDYGTFNFYAVPIKTELVDSVKLLIEEELFKLKSQGKDSITDEEMQRVKNQVIANEIYAQDRNRGVGFRIGRTLITTGDLRDMIEYPKRIQAVSKDDVRAVIEKYFVPKNRTIVTLLPEEQSQ